MVLFCKLLSILFSILGILFLILDSSHRAANVYRSHQREL